MSDEVVYAPELVRDAEANPLEGVTAISVGDKHACGRLENGNLVCWGDDYYGQLGSDEAPAGRNRFVTVALANVVEVAAGAMHSCALVQDGQVYCWGNNEGGQLGTGDTVGKTTPLSVLMVGLDRARSLHAGPGALSTCMQLRNGRVYCWGYNYYGQLGLGTIMQIYPTPTEITVWP